VQTCPNGRADTVIKKITDDEDLIFGEKVSDLREGRLTPAKPQKMQESDVSVLPLGKDRGRHRTQVKNPDQPVLPTANITDGDFSGVDLEGSSYLTIYVERRAQQSLFQLPK